jgi:hypothetical protein
MTETMTATGSNATVQQQRVATQNTQPLGDAADTINDATINAKHFVGVSTATLDASTLRMQYKAPSHSIAVSVEGEVSEATHPQRFAHHNTTQTSKIPGRTSCAR